MNISRMILLRSVTASALYLPILNKQITRRRLTRIDIEYGSHGANVSGRRKQIFTNAKNILIYLVKIATTNSRIIF